MFRKTITLLLIVIILVSFSSTSFAADILENNTEISIMMTNISTYSCNLDISSSGLSTSSAYMTAYSGTDRVRISMYLQRYDNGWSTIKHWTAEAGGTYASISRNYYVSSGYSYRVLVYYYAYAGSHIESSSKTSSKYY